MFEEFSVQCSVFRVGGAESFATEIPNDTNRVKVCVCTNVDVLNEFN